MLRPFRHATHVAALILAGLSAPAVPGAARAATSPDLVQEQADGVDRAVALARALAGDAFYASLADKLSTGDAVARRRGTTFQPFGPPSRRQVMTPDAAERSEGMRSRIRYGLGIQPDRTALDLLVYDSADAADQAFATRRGWPPDASATPLLLTPWIVTAADGRAVQLACGVRSGAQGPALRCSYRLPSSQVLGTVFGPAPHKVAGSVYGPADLDSAALALKLAIGPIEEALGAPPAATANGAAPNLARATGEGCGTVTGEWSWFIGGVASFSADGQVAWRATPASPRSLDATWSCDPSTRTITVAWQQGLVDTLHLSPDGSSLAGQNQKGVAVTGERYVPGAAKPQPASKVDPAVVGWWELEVQFMTPQGPTPVLWRIKPDGTYAIKAGSLSHAGTMTAQDGKWTLHATTSAFEDGGTYEMPDWATLVNHARGGTGRWHRRDPALTLKLAQVASRPIPEGVPELADRASALALTWQPDAALARVEFQAAEMNLGARLAMRFTSMRSGNGLSITTTPQGTSFFVLRGGGGSSDAIPPGFLDLPEAWGIARQEGVPPPLKRATLSIWHPPGQDPVLAWTFTSAQGNARGGQIDGATGVVLEGDLSGYVAAYNAQWQQAIAGLRRLFARAAPHGHGSAFSSGGGSSSSSSGSGDSGGGSSDNGDDWARETALQNAWEAGDMPAYERIQNGEASWGDTSEYGGD